MALIQIGTIPVLRTDQINPDLVVAVVPLAAIQEELAAEGRLYNCVVSDVDLVPQNGFFICLGQDVIPVCKEALEALGRRIQRVLSGEEKFPSRLEQALEASKDE